MFNRIVIISCLFISIFSYSFVNATLSDSIAQPDQGVEITADKTQMETNPTSPDDTMLDSKQQPDIGDGEVTCTTPSETQQGTEELSSTTPLATSTEGNETANTNSKKSWSVEDAAKKGFCNVCKKIYTDYLEGDSLDPTKLAIVASAGIVEYFVGVVWDNRSELLDYYLCFGG